VINTTGNATVGNMTVTGDLEVQGTTTTLNTETLDVEDANITINKGGTDASAEGAGLTIKGTGGSDLGGVEYDSSLNSKFKVGDATKREILTADGQQSVTNKDIDGGTASNTSRISVPRGADLATLQALTRKQGAIVYNQDKNEFLGDTGTELKTIGGGGGLVPLAIDHTFAGTIERDTEYMVDLSAGSLAVNLPVGLGDEQYKIAFNIRVIEQGTYDLTISSQSSQDIYWNEVADTSFLIDEDVRVEFAWDGTQWTAKSAWYPTYTNLPEASATESGIVTTGTQSFAGDKTFTGNVDANSYTGLPVASDTVAGIVNRYDSGTYTPSIVKGPTGSVVNAATIRKAFFEVLNNRVRVSIYVSLSLSTAGTGDQDFDITVPSSYPIASGSYNAVGTITNNTSIFKSGIIRSAGNTTEVLASFVKDSGNTGTINYCILFEYDTTA
jgi:hypothetical protein